MADTTPTLSKASQATLRDFRKLLETADELLVSRNGAPLSAEEMMLLSGPLGWDRRKIEAQRGRGQEVRRWLAKAGSKAEFEAAELALAEAEKLDHAERPAIVEAFEEARKVYQQKVAALDAQLNAARTKVEAMVEARSHLRQLAPEFAKIEYESRQQQNRQRLMQVREDLRTQLGICDRMPNLNIRLHADRDLAKAYIGSHLRADEQERLIEAGEAPGSTQVNERAWSDHVDELRAMRDDVAADLAKVEADMESSEQEARTALDYYVDHYGLA